MATDSSVNTFTSTLNSTLHIINVPDVIIKYKKPPGESDHIAHKELDFNTDGTLEYSYIEKALTSIYNLDPDYRPAPQQITYTAFNKLETLIDTLDNGDTLTLSLDYGVDNQRRKSVLTQPSAGNKTKYFFGNYEIISDDKGTKEYIFINSPTGLSAVVEFYNDNGIRKKKIWHAYTDHLGSLVYLENADNSNETLNYSYDSWGNPRKHSDWLDEDPVDELIADRGYTGHEHLTEFGLINMNGRVYDPKLGRFLSPDPFVQSPGRVAGFNRYAYVMNNPLKYTDPSGYIFQEPEAPMVSRAGMSYNENYNRLVYSPFGSVGFDYLSSFDRAYGLSQNQIGFSRISASRGLYSYNWNTRRYEDVYGNEVDFNTALNHTIDYFGEDCAERYIIYEHGTSLDGGKTIIGSGVYSMIREGIMVSNGLFPEFSNHEMGNTFVRVLNSLDNYRIAGMAPDAFTVSLDIDIIVGVGSEFSPIGFGHILNGSDKNKSFSFNDASDAFNRTFGFNVSAGVEVYFWFYTGDPANFTTTISTTSAEKPSSTNPAGLSE